MVFQPEAQFRQLCHCNFRENIVKLLYIPLLNAEPVFLIVNKYGKIGLYNPKSFALIHTYLLDLTVPMHPDMHKALRHVAKYNRLHHPQPKCQQTHLVVDAVYCPDFKTCMFLTSKGILQCYDIGEIETQSIGLELLPRKEFMGLKVGQPVLPICNLGHVETHRLYGLRVFPTCMHYSPGPGSSADETKNKKLENTMGTGSQILIGDTEGCVTIIAVEAPEQARPIYLFGLRKIRGMRHELNAIDLFHANVLKVYKGHNGPVKQLMLLRPRQLVVSCCATDRRYSLFVNDMLVERAKPYVVSCRKGINTFAHSSVLKLMATGSNDFIIRLFNDFVTQMPQMELAGHRAPILSVEFINVSFLKSQILLSYSKDVELRAWDPVNYVCLQSIHVSFPPKSALICKTPEFAQSCLYVHQPHYSGQEDGDMNFGFAKPGSSMDKGKEDDSKSRTRMYNPEITTDGDIILFYCNSYTKLYIEKDASAWPFDFDDFMDEFEAASAKLEQKVLHRQKSMSRHPETYLYSKINLSKKEIVEIDENLDKTTKDILGIKKYVDRKLGVQRSYTFDHDSSKSVLHPDRGHHHVEAEAGQSNMSLSTRAMKRYHALERDKKFHAKEDFIQQGIAFKAMPIYEIEPLTFRHLQQSAALEIGNSEPESEPIRGMSMPVTDTMRAAGITSIQNVDALSTPAVQHYFSKENLKQVLVELQLTENTLRHQIEGLVLEDPGTEPEEDTLEPGPPSRRPSLSPSSSSNATTISSFSSKLIQESNPTLVGLGVKTFLSQPGILDGDYDAPNSIYHSQSISASESARYEEIENAQGLTSDTDEVPDLASDSDNEPGHSLQEMPFESSSC